MKLDDLNSLSHNKSNDSKTSFFSDFLKELQKVITNFLSTSNNISTDSVFVVRDVNDNKLSLVNASNGEDMNIYAITSKEELTKLNNKGIWDNIYEISKEDLYELNLGSNITIKDGKCLLYLDEFKIENPLAASKLEDLYFCLEQEKDSIYSICEISDNKIFLTDTKEGGYFSIPREAYPNFNLGDLVKNVNGKYVLI